MDKQALQNKKLSFEERMKIATINDNTRSYLVIIGKISDAMHELTNCVGRDWGEHQVDKIMAPVYDDSGNIIEKVLGLLGDGIHDEAMLGGSIEI